MLFLQKGFLIASGYEHRQENWNARFEDVKSCTHSKIADLQNGIPFGKVAGKGDKGK